METEYDIYKNRFHRTVEVKVQGTGQFLTRYDFKDQIDVTVGMEYLEACGPTGVGILRTCVLRTAYRHTGILRTKNCVQRTQITRNEQRYLHAGSPVFCLHACIHAKCNMHCHKNCVTFSMKLEFKS